MNLQTRLIGGFFAVATITLLVSVVGYWQTKKLASALYEVGVVRMPSVQALDLIFEAKTSLDASKRELMREVVEMERRQKEAASASGSTNESPAQARDFYTLSSEGGGWGDVLLEELKRQKNSWGRAEKGLRTYGAQPKSQAEDAKWQTFLPVWSSWRESYEKVMGLLSQARDSGDHALLVTASRENDDNLYDLSRRSRELLVELHEINNEAAAATKQASVASTRDMRVFSYLMLLAALVSFAGALGCGVFMSRLIRKPIGQMAEAFSRISRGELKTRLPVNTRDEIGEMAEAMNRTMDTLRSSEVRFRAVFENSFDAIGVFTEGRMTMVNPALLALFRCRSEQEVIGRPVLDFVASSDHAYIKDRIQRRARGEQLSPTYELTGVRADGETFTMELHTASFVLDGVTHVVAIHRDVTERRVSASLLAESARRLELALDTSKLGVFRRNLATGAEEWDDRMLEIYGLPPGSPAPTREQQLARIVAEDQAHVSRHWSETSSTGTSRLQFRINLPDGGVRHVEVHEMAQGEPRPSPEWIIGVTGDITGIVDAAAESVRLREQLLQAQKMESLGNLSAGVAHDFNNLLTSINGFVDLAAESLPTTHEASGFLKHARQATHSARGLVRRILTFSRRTQEVEQTIIDVGDVVTDTAPLVSAALPSRVKLTLDISAALPPIYADSGQLQQVLMNLCTNGAHAIGSQSGELRIGVREYEFRDTTGTVLPAGCRTGRYICLSVSDNGAGMDEVMLQRIFDPFFTTKKPGEGTGLGLAIVKDIVTTHDGGIAVESTPGQGTRFALYFPVAEGHNSEKIPPEPILVQRGQGQQILVVDDEPAITSIVQIILKKAGYNPEVFNSSNEAWTRFELGPKKIQLLMIDQQMPGISGADFIDRARQLHPRLPVIAMSGRFESSEATDGLLAAGVVRMRKPFELDELLGEVARALATRSA